MRKLLIIELKKSLEQNAIKILKATLTKPYILGTFVVYLLWLKLINDLKLYKTEWY